MPRPFVVQTDSGVSLRRNQNHLNKDMTNRDEDVDNFSDIEDSNDESTVSYNTGYYSQLLKGKGWDEVTPYYTKAGRKVVPPARYR